MWKCKVCEEKDKRVASLEQEISFLRSLVHRPVDNRTLPSVTLEADGVISGSDQVLEIQTHADSQAEDIAATVAERNSILDGSY